MALVNEAGEYVTIENVSRSEISYSIYKDADHRKRFKDGKMGRFERVLNGVACVETDLQAKVAPEKTLEDNIKTAAYETLMTLEEFAGYESDETK